MSIYEYDEEKLPSVSKEFISKHNGLSLDNGCRFDALEELDDVNKELQVNIYQPDTVAIGNDGGDLVFLMKQEKETPKEGVKGLVTIKRAFNI